MQPPSGCFGRHLHNLPLQSTNNLSPVFVSAVMTGWQREAFISSLFMNTTTQAPSTHPFNKQQAIIAMSVLDFVGVVLYFAVTFGLVWVARTLVHDADVNTVTIHDYSIRVERLPDDATADELAEFFTQYGEVRHLPVDGSTGLCCRNVQCVMSWLVMSAYHGAIKKAAITPY